MRYCKRFNRFCDEQDSCLSCPMNVAFRMRRQKYRASLNGFIKEANTKFKTLKLKNF